MDLSQSGASFQQSDAFPDAFLFGEEENSEMRRPRKLPVLFRDLDRFTAALYAYYRGHGLAALAARCARRLVCGFAGVLLFATLTLFVNWEQVARCAAADALDESAICNQAPFLTWMGLGNSWLRFAFLCTVVFGIHWVWLAFVAGKEVQKLWPLRQFVHSSLGFEDRQLPLLDWKQVVDRLQQRRPVEIATTQSLDHVSVANRIMRVHNFLIALVHEDALRLASRPWVFCSLLEWNLHHCVLRPLFMDDWNVNSAFLADARHMRRRFLRMGLLNLVLLPFIFLHAVSSFVLRNVEDLYSSRTSGLAQREWTLWARWSLREWNELPHLFERRLQRAGKAAGGLLELSQNPASVELAQTASYLLGSLTSVLIMLMLLSDSAVLTRISVGGFSLLSYFTAFVLLRTIVRTQATPVAGGFHARALKLCRNVCRLLHLPAPPPLPGPSRAPVPTSVHLTVLLDGETARERKRQTNSGGGDHRPSPSVAYQTITATQQQMGELYRHRFVVLVQELLGMLYTPIALLIDCPWAAENILVCLRTHLAENNAGLGGAVCRSAVFSTDIPADSTKMQQSIDCFQRDHGLHSLQQPAVSAVSSSSSSSEPDDDVPMASSSGSDEETEQVAAVPAAPPPHRKDDHQLLLSVADSGMADDLLLQNVDASVFQTKNSSLYESMNG